MINIGDHAFMNTAFSNSPIIRYVKSIGTSAFTNCSNLYTTEIGNCLCECIGEYAFAGCMSLNYAYFNSKAGYISSTNDVTLTVKSGAFAGCLSLEQIYFFNISKIEQTIFPGDTRLSSIYLINSMINSIARLESINAFEDQGLPSNYVIYVDSSLYNQYISDSIWGLISTHIQSY